MELVNWTGARVLVVGAHVDDEVLCAGTLCRAGAGGAELHVLAFSSAADSLPDGSDKERTRREFDASCRLLGMHQHHCLDLPVRHLPSHRQEILERLVATSEIYRPHVVFCPASSDMHQDHQVIHAECRRAFRNRPWVLGWESPNNERGSFDARIFVSLEADDVESKAAAWSVYQSQHHRPSYSAELIYAMAVVRGHQCRAKTKLAEAFELVSMTL